MSFYVSVVIRLQRYNILLKLYYFGLLKKILIHEIVTNFTPFNVFLGHFFL